MYVRVGTGEIRGRVQSGSIKGWFRISVPPVTHWGHLQSFKTPDARALPPERWFNWARALLWPQEFSKPPWVVLTRSPGREQQASREDEDSAGNTEIPPGT